MESIVFGITVIIVVFLFLLQINKMTNGFLTTLQACDTINSVKIERFMQHINKLEDRIQTGDAKQAMILNKEQPEQEKPKPNKVSIGTAVGLEVAKKND
jgi:hypothetical protein